MIAPTPWSVSVGGGDQSAGQTLLRLVSITFVYLLPLTIREYVEIPHMAQ